MDFDSANSADPFSSPGGQASFDIKKVLETLRRFYWILFITVALGGGLSFLYLKTTKPLYSSTAEFKVERRSTTPSVSMTGANALEGATTPEDLKTIEQSFLSPLLMRRVIARLGLTDTDNFIEADRPAADVTEGELVGYLLANSSIALVPDTRLLQISFESWSPKYAELVANAIVEEGIALDREQRIESVDVNVRYLQNEAAKQESNLKKSEEKLNKYTEQVGIVSIDSELNIVADQLRDLNSRHTAIKSERLKLESDYEQIQTCLGDPDKLLEIESIRKVPSVERLYLRAGELRGQLVKLAQRYRPANPLMIQTETEIKEVDATLKQEILQAPKSIEMELAAVRRNEENIARVEEKQEAKVIEVKKLAIESQVYQRQIEADRLAYEFTLKRLSEELSQARSQPVLLQVVDPAGPAWQTSVKPMRVLATGIMGGLFLGAGLLFLIMQLDSSIKTVEDAESAFKLSVLAAIPAYAPVVPEEDVERGAGEIWKKRIGDSVNEAKSGLTSLLDRRKREARRELALPGLVHSPVLTDEYSTAAEGFRTLRAAIQNSEGSIRTNLILVTSPLPGEGKSFCAMNLAVAMAQSGQRTLLVDAQLRRPVMEERIFSSRGFHGLSDFLEGDAGFSSIIRATPVPNLDIITAGTPTDHPAEILSRQRFREFLDEAQPHYDKVIFDSAAIAPVSDTLCFARFFPVICFVLGSGITSRSDGKRAIELLGRSGAKPFGAVLNLVVQKSASYDGPDARRFTSAEERDSLDFPKSCPSCGRVYSDFDDYLKRTLPPGDRPTPPGGDPESQRNIKFFRVCPCGSPVLVDAANRRDVTDSGLGRRRLFGEIRDRLTASGMDREEARTKLLLTLKIWRNEIYGDSHLDSSEAGMQRRHLFTQMLDHLAKSGLSREEARAKLLQAIQIWRDAP